MKARVSTFGAKDGARIDGVDISQSNKAPLLGSVPDKYATYPDYSGRIAPLDARSTPERGLGNFAISRLDPRAKLLPR